MRNNKSTAEMSLRANECVEVLYQQILGNIKRDGQGQFYNVRTEIEVLPFSKTEVFIQLLK
jgi:hypothetical protein